MPTNRWARLRALTVARRSLAAPGCDRLTAALEKAQDVRRGHRPARGLRPSHRPVLSEHEQLVARLALYVEWRDRASRRIRQSWQRYDEHVDADGTPAAPQAASRSST